MRQYAIVIIGVGIHGAGCAQAATAAGFNCLVLEQYSKLGQGTSGRSSKLIHGGKLTAYRATSERLIRKISPLLPRRKPRADTRELYLARPR